MSILDDIVAAKREALPGLAREASELRRRAETADPPRAFEPALRGTETVQLIAEVKRRSPSAGWIRPGVEAVEVAVAYERAGAAAISVLTDETYFGGSLADLAAVRRAVRVPVLRKDFILDPVQLWEARAAEADAVLLIVRLLDDARLRDLLALSRELGMGALVEVHTAGELSRALHAGAVIIGVNSRDLATLSIDMGLTLRLVPEIAPDRIVVAESGIRSPEDVDRLAAAGVDAVLVGETLMRSPDIRVAAAALVGRARTPRGTGAVR